MKTITKYQSDNGKEFNTQREALAEDTKELIRNIVEARATHSMDKEQISDMIIENSKVLKILLTELEGLQSEKTESKKATQGNVDFERNVITGNRSV